MQVVAQDIYLSFLLAGLWWALTRSALAVIGSPAWQKAGTDALAPFMLGGLLLLFASSDFAPLLGAGARFWAAALPPAAFYFYLAFRFARWRWRRRADHGQPIRIDWRPRSPITWAVYIWFGVWVVWQVVHGFAPQFLPRWLS